MTNHPFQVEWRPSALEDLSAILRHIAKDNPKRAKDFAKELRAKAELLALHPQMGRIGRPGLPDWVRELVAHRNYIILYRLVNTSRTVEILRIKHAAQQMPG